MLPAWFTQTSTNTTRRALLIKPCLPDLHVNQAHTLLIEPKARKDQHVVVRVPPVVAWAPAPVCDLQCPDLATNAHLLKNGLDLTNRPERTQRLGLPGQEIPE